MAALAGTAYAGVAYWLFWHAIQKEEDETNLIVCVRAVLYLLFGPIALAALFLFAGIIAIIDRH